MFTRISMRAIAILGVAGPVAAQAPAEWLVQAARPELKVGFEASKGGTSITERIPPGETVQDWSRMVTTQRFGGVIASGLTLPTFVNQFVGGLRRACPNYRLEKPVHSDQAGRPVVKFQVDCPLNPATGKPETLLLHAISGATDLHVVQVAFRHVPTRAEMDWAQAHLATVLLCDGKSTGAACRVAP